MPSTNGHGLKRAILYARVSTDEQVRSGYSLAQQLDALREYATREGYEVIEEVQDPGQSGASLERPGMDRVRDLVVAGGVSVVLAQDRDRFAREPAYHYLLRKELEEHGCTLRALNDRGDDSPEGELTDGILDQHAKFERAKTTERTRRGRLRKAREGKVVGTAPPRYGFRYNEARNGLVIYEPEMRIVEKVFRLVAEGLGLHALQTRLRSEGIPTRNGAQLWSRAVLRRMLWDDIYKPHSYKEIKELVSQNVAAQLNPSEEYGIGWWNRRKVSTRTISELNGNGERIYKKRQVRKERPREDWIAIPVPAFLPRELVDAARASLESNKGTERKFLNRSWELKGLLHCSCGSRMRTHTVYYPNGAGHRYYYYVCRKAKDFGRIACQQKSVRAEPLETLVWGFASSLLKDPNKVRAGVESLIQQEKQTGGPSDREREARPWTEKLAEVSNMRTRYQEMAAKGLITFEELGARLRELEETRKTAEVELSSLRNTQRRVKELERDRDTLIETISMRVPEALDNLAPEEKNKLYRMLRLQATRVPEGWSLSGVFCTNELRS
jgi:site-specific DNA recombinase